MRSETTDEDFSEYYADLAEFEGKTNYLYCDIRGFVTVGIGNLVKTPDVCVGMPFFDSLTTRPATAEQKVKAFHAVRAAFKPDAGSVYYKKFTNLRLPDSYVEALVRIRLAREFIPGIKALLPGFDGFPLGARKALVDIAYNCGLGGFAKFSNLIAACEAQDWKAASEHCRRKTSREVRNAWTRDQFLSCL